MDSSITRPFLKGEKVFVRPLAASDFPLIAGWLNDPKVTHFMFYGQLPTTLAQVEKMMMDQVASHSNVVFAVCDIATERPIGFAGLYDLHLTAQKAEFRVLIGEADFWGKGYGTEVTELLTFYGFDRLNLHKVSLGFTHENKGAARAYEKAGYVHEGILRDDIYRNGRFYDSVKMSLLREEYYAKYFEKHVAKFRPTSNA